MLVFPAADAFPATQRVGSDFTSMDRFEAEIPPTSILREFIGGSCFEY